MKFLIFLFSSTFFFHLSFAQEKKCNPVGIKFQASTAVYADKDKEDAEEKYIRALKSKTLQEMIVLLKEAHESYAKAYKTISDDRAKIVSDIFAKECSNAPMVFGTTDEAPSNGSAQ